MKKTTPNEAPIAEEVAPPPAAAPVNAQMIPLEKIFPSPTNPRKHWPAEAQAEMEASMRSIGFTISTLLLRPDPWTYYRDTGAKATEAENSGQFWIMRRRGEIEEAVEFEPTLALAEEKLAKMQGRYELVAGERRWRAAKAVRIAEAPCIVQTLSDREVLEIQLIENAQREDLTVMEEAIGYGRLLELRDEKGELIYTVKKLAQRLGKSVDVVHRLRRLRVLADDPAMEEFRAALDKGVVGFKHAILVTGVPDAKARSRFAKEILDPKYHEAPLTLRRAEELRQRDYMVDLRTATFDTKDAALLPVEIDEWKNRLRGGSCVDCPFRAGNAVSDFDGGLPTAMHQMCMNPGCYTAKADIGWKRWQEEETDPARRRRALSEDACKKIYRYGDQLDWNSPYVDLAHKPDSSDLKAGVEAPGTWRSMLKNADLEVLVVRDRNGRKHELVDRSLARAAIEKASKDVGEKSPLKPESKSGNGSSGGSGRMETPEERADRAREAERREELAAAGRDAVAAALDAKASSGKPLPEGFWTEMMETWLDDFYGEEPEELEARRGWKNGSLVSEMKKLEPHHQVGVAVEFLYRITAGISPVSSRETTVLKLFGIDGKKILKDTEATLKAEHKKCDAVLEEIAKLAGVATLKDKDLDGIAKALWKKSYAELRASHELEAVRDEIKKRRGGPTCVAVVSLEQAKKENAAAKPAGKKGAIALKLSPEARTKIAAAQRARWAAQAKKKGAKK